MIEDYWLRWWSAQDRIGWLKEFFFFFGIALCHLFWLHYFFLSNVYFASPNLWTTLCCNPKVCTLASCTLSRIQAVGICLCAMLYHNQPNMPSFLQIWQLARTRAMAWVSPEQHNMRTLSRGRWHASKALEITHVADFYHNSFYKPRATFCKLLFTSNI